MNCNPQLFLQTQMMQQPSTSHLEYSLFVVYLNSPSRQTVNPLQTIYTPTITWTREIIVERCLYAQTEETWGKLTQPDHLATLSQEKHYSLPWTLTVKLSPNAALTVQLSTNMYSLAQQSTIIWLSRPTYVRTLHYHMAHKIKTQYARSDACSRRVASSERYRAFDTNLGKIHAQQSQRRFISKLTGTILVLTPTLIITPR